MVDFQEKNCYAVMMMIDFLNNLSPGEVLKHVIVQGVHGSPILSLPSVESVECQGVDQVKGVDIMPLCKLF